MAEDMDIYEEELEGLEDLERIIEEGEKDYQILLREFVDSEKYVLGYTVGKREANAVRTAYTLSLLAEEYGLRDTAQFIRDIIEKSLNLNWTIEGQGRKLTYRLFGSTVQVSTEEVT